MKKILAIYYSQSGQLDEIMKNFISEIKDCDIDLIRFRPKNDFPFPWSSDVFFDAMPDCVNEIPVELEKINYKYSKYDLILLGYQPWYLSPSIPVSSLLVDMDFRLHASDSPVITIIGSRNMWINSQKNVSDKLAEINSKIIGNIPLIDRNQNQISAITILHWMTTGLKTKKNRFLPKPGISEEDIRNASEFGNILSYHLSNGSYTGMQENFCKTGKFELSTEVWFIEKLAKRIFKIWAKIINSAGKKHNSRLFRIRVFKYYLFFALFFIAPIVLLIYKILIVPFIYRRIQRKKEYICCKIKQ